jgi:peptidoglycan/LPS O-acetylase OafA/YrhL
MMIHPVTSTALQVSICLVWALGFSGWLRVLYDLKWEPASRAGDMVKNSIHGLALCSYSVYLVHVLFFTDIRTLIDAWPRGPVKSGFILASTFLLSLVFYFLVERPTIRMRDKYLGRAADKSTEPEAATASEAMAYGASATAD